MKCSLGWTIVVAAGLTVVGLAWAAPQTCNLLVKGGHYCCMNMEIFERALGNDPLACFTCEAGQTCCPVILSNKKQYDGVRSPQSGESGKRAVEYLVAEGTCEWRVTVCSGHGCVALTLVHVNDCRNAAPIGDACP